jgi:biopolymer transport protein ExbB
VADLERAVNLAHRLEAERLRKNIGTLRRLAAIAPLLGLLGTLLALGRMLSTLGANDGAGASVWGPAVASALGPFTAGVGVAVLALVAFDGLMIRAESLIAALDLAGAETIDAVAMSLPVDPRPSAPLVHGPARTPHQVRIEAPHPHPAPRSVAEETEFE